jgi:hypothetical protein
LYIKGATSDDNTSLFYGETNSSIKVVNVTSRGITQFYDPSSATPRIISQIGFQGEFDAGSFILYKTAVAKIQLTASPNNYNYINNSNNFGIGITTPSAQLHVKGSGTTSSTTSFLVQNSAGTTGLTVFDNGNISVGSATNSFYQLYGNGSWFNAGSIYTSLLYTDTISPSAGGSTNFYTNINNFKIGTTSTATTSAVFEISSTTKGFLLPRTNLTSNISSPAQGLMTYVTASATEGIYYYNSGSYQGWTKVLNNSGSQVISGSLELTTALTASNAIISGNVTVLGTASINTLIVNQTQLSTGSNQLGDAANDFQTLYGTVVIPTGSLTVTGSTNITGSITVDLGAIGANATDGLFLQNTASATAGTRQRSPSLHFRGASWNDTSGGRSQQADFNIQYVPDTPNGNGSGALTFFGQASGSTNDSLLTLGTGTGGSSKTVTVTAPGGFIANGAYNTQLSYVIVSQNISQTNTGQTSYFLGKLGIGLTAPTARLQVQGSGTTSSTTALLVQNANASASLAVLDNGNVGIGISNPTGSLHINGATTSSLSNSLLIQNSGSTRTLSYTEDGTLTLSNGVYTTKWYMGSSYIPTLEFSSGGTILWGTGNSLNFLGNGVDYRIGYQNSFATTNASMSFSAGHKGFFSFVTVGTTTTYNAIGSIFSDNSNSGLILNYKSASVDTEGIRLTSTGRVGIGVIAPNYKLDVSGSGNFTGNLTITGSATNSLLVKGSGATSATTSLLVQNSSGLSALTITDDRTTTIENSGGITSLIIRDNTGLNSVFGNGQFQCPPTIYRNSSGILSFYTRANDGVGIEIQHNNSQQSVQTGVAMLNIGGGYNTQQGCQFSSLLINPTYDLNANTNITSSARGIYYNPTITNLRVAQHRAIETTSGNIIFNSGSVGIGILTPSASLHVSGAVIIDNGLFDTVSTGSIPTGSTLIYTINTGSYQAGFFDYYISSGSNFRAGNIMSVWGAGTYKFTDLATPDIGSTSNLQFSMSLSASSAQLFASASSAGWTVKTTFRTI